MEIILSYKTSCQISPDDWETFREAKKFTEENSVKDIIEYMQNKNLGYAEINMV